MRIRLSFIFLLFTCCSHFSYAQQCIIKGKIQDTLNRSYLPNATVTLLHASDSVMETFARTKDDGSFELKAATGDRYLIMITYPGFADYIDIITVKEGKTKDMGNVPMQTRSHLLTEFVFQQNRGAIKVKGDTIEYVADSFKTKDNATVEDLLKKLPGLQVDKNGQVTAQGEKVQKILVDGEEFFSDDPAVVTKNLQANAVQNVQVFDKKSDQAEFTGIDDGVKTKTINLELKEDKKKGYFGKAAVGGGTDGFFENQAMINDFKGKRQLSAFGIISNTSKIGLGWNDAGKYSDNGMTTLVGADGSITNTFSNTNNDDLTSWDGSYNGEGLPTVWTGGLHYADKWAEDKQHISANYRFAKQNMETTGNTTTQYLLPGSSYTSSEKRNTFSSAIRHNGNGLYEWKIDSTSDLKVTAGGNYSDTKRRSGYTTESIAAGDTLNSGTRYLNGEGNSKSENADILWRKKFKKKGRTVSVDLNENYKEGHSSDTLISANTLYIDTLGLHQFTLNTNQQKINDNSTFNMGGKIEYTEPLSKVAYLDVSYNLAVNNSEAAKTTRNANAADGAYTDVDSLFSSHYAYNVLTNIGGLNMRFVYKKFNFSFGGSVGYSNFAQHDLDPLHDTTNNYSYLNFFPRVNFNYKFGQQSNLLISYNGATKQPTIDQIQPLLDNTDPLNIAQGNPDLKQEFRHTIFARYNDYHILTNRYLWINGSFTIVQNAITRTDNVTDGGLRTYKYVNTNGNYVGWGYIGYGFKIPKTQLQMGIVANTSIAHTNTLVNNDKNVSNNNSYTGGLRFNYDKDEKYDLSLSPEITYFDNKATISTFSTNYATAEINFEGSVQLPLKFELGATLDWFLRQKTDVFTTNNDVFLLNGYVSKKFLKKSQLELRAYVNDIFKQNVGFNRFAQSNYITENNYNTISRYGMLNLIWNFAKTPAGMAPDNGGGMRFRK